MPEEAPLLASCPVPGQDGTLPRRAMASPAPPSPSVKKSASMPPQMLRFGPLGSFGQTGHAGTSGTGPSHKIGYASLLPWLMELTRARHGHEHRHGRGHDYTHAPTGNTCTQTTLTQTRAQTHWVQAHRRRDDAARARLRRTLHLPRVEGKGTPGIGGEGGARARPEPPPCLLLLRARRRWRGMRFGCCAPGTGERNDHSERRADRRSGFRSAEGVSLGRTAAVWSSGEPSTW